LANLPWEYLYNSKQRKFVSLSTETPIVRYVELPERIKPFAVTPPLRVLVMISSPTDYPQLNVEQEWTKLKEAVAALETRGSIILERLSEATLGSLQRRLRRGEYHIFHFIGHGAFEENDGVLILERPDKRGCSVSGGDLGTLLHDHRSLRMSVLNACEGARSSRTDPFSGVAQSLVLQGIPAVIAMQFEISDQAAISLAHEFYGAVADGYPVDAALAEARKAVFAEGNAVEWGTPVLYLRAPDGRIFDIPASARREVAPENSGGQSSATLRYCIHCGACVGRGDVYCTNCGQTAEA
jgi:CHAT domain-containing protein